MFHTTHTLPPLTADEQAHSERLIALIGDELDRHQNWISFERYMELALYAPGLGYYSAGSHKLGAGGDFITAPETSPFFSRCIASQCALILHTLKGGDVLELGAGNGIMAADLLLQLEKLDSLPQYYYIVEVSADLRQRQQQLLQATIPHLFERIRWLSSLPEAFVGFIVANEVLDALPVQRFIVEGESIKELGVSRNRGLFHWQSQSINARLSSSIEHIVNDIGHSWSEGYCSEVNLLLPHWINALSSSLQRGVMLFIDYGLPRKQYYDFHRSQGTLNCFFKHRQHDNPFIHVGMQDITSWVDFTALAEAGINAELELLGFSTQAHFLIGAGIKEMLQIAMQEHELLDTQRWQLSQQVQRLMLPDGMGETFKAMAFSKHCELELPAFAFKDLRYLL